MILRMEDAELRTCHQVNPGYSESCIVDFCMAWRWFDKFERLVIVATNRNAVTEDEAGPKPPVAVKGMWRFCECETDPASWVEPESEARERRRGYCGLAGKPEFD